MYALHIVSNYLNILLIFQYFFKMEIYSLYKYAHVVGTMLNTVAVAELLYCKKVSFACANLGRVMYYNFYRSRVTYLVSVEPRDTQEVCDSPL